MRDFAVMRETSFVIGRSETRKRFGVSTADKRQTLTADYAESADPFDRLRGRQGTQTNVRSELRHCVPCRFELRATDQTPMHA
jgi:hypothetical protein